MHCHFLKTSFSQEGPETLPLTPILYIILLWLSLDPGVGGSVSDYSKGFTTLPSPGEKLSSCPTGVGFVHVTTCPGLLLGTVYNPKI